MGREPAVSAASPHNLRSVECVRTRHLVLHKTERHAQHYFKKELREAQSNGTSKTAVKYHLRRSSGPSHREKCKTMWRRRWFRKQTYQGLTKGACLFGLIVTDPPPLNWSTLMLWNEEEDHDGKEKLQARGDCLEAAAG